MRRHLIAAVGPAVLIASAAWGCGSNETPSTDGGPSAKNGNAPSGDGAAGSGSGGSGVPGSSGTTSHTASSSGGSSGSSSGSSGSGGSSGSSGSSGGSSSGGSDAAAPGSEGGAGDSGTNSGMDGSTADAGPACTKTITTSMDCNAPVAPGDQKDCMLGTREYLIYAPKNMDVCNPIPLVIDGHGASETAQQQLYGMPPFCAGAGTCWNGPGSGWRLEAEMPEGGFLLVTPQGINNMWSNPTDPDYMVQLVQQIQTVANIDPKKVYITGISNGAALSYWTACQHADVFTGLSPNSGGTLNQITCSPSKPLLDIQFDDMPDFAFSDSQSSVTGLAMTQNCQGPKMWNTYDSTTTDPVCLANPDMNNTTLVPCNSIMPAVQPTTCQIWDQCMGQNVSVVFCQVAAGTLHGAANASIDGHIIYENSTNLNTPSVAWRFFRSFW